MLYGGGSIIKKKLIRTGVLKAYNKGKLRKGLGTGPWRNKNVYDRDYKALWAMKEVYLEAGDPKHGYANKDIFIRPHAEWHFLIQKTREKHAALEKRLNSSKN